MDRGRELRVGVVGAGWVAQARHIPALARNPSVRVVAVADRHAERAAAGARLASADAVSCATLGEVIERGVDAVSIATPPWPHADLATEALEAGCHVFCEKPMAMNTAEAEAMAATAQRVGRVLCVSHNLLFSRSVQRADAILATTPPSYVTGMQLSSFARRLPTWFEDLPGGLMMDESPHMLYVLTHFLGAPLTLAHARASYTRDSKNPATIELMLQGARGPGSVTMCFDTPVSEWHVGLVSPARVVSLDLFRDIATSIGPDGEHKARDIAQTSAKAMTDHVLGYVRTGWRLAAKRQFWGHDELINRFVTACRTAGPSPVDPRDSVSIVKLTDDVLQALDLGSA